MAWWEEKEFLKENVRKCVFLSYGDLGFRMGAGKCESVCRVMFGVLLCDGYISEQEHTQDCQHTHPIPSTLLTPQAYFPAWPTLGEAYNN